MEIKLKRQNKKWHLVINNRTYILTADQVAEKLKEVENE